MTQDAPQPAQIAHILFLDIIGWSRESINEQGRLLADLSRLVTECPTFQRAKATNELLAFPSGDGMWILFRTELTGPARVALELFDLLRSVPDLEVRMGIHSGPVSFQRDIAGTQTVVGDGINTAKRVMDMGENGEIVVSAQHARWLLQFDEWSSRLIERGFGVTKHGERIELYALLPDDVQAPVVVEPVLAAPPRTPRSPGEGKSLALLYKRNAHPDDLLLSTLEAQLTELGHDVFVDRHLKIGIEWASAIDEKIRTSDAVVAIVSDSALESEMLEYELEIAKNERVNRGKPFLLPIRVGEDRRLEGPIGSYVNDLHFTVWRGPEDDARVVSEVDAALTEPPKRQETELALEPVGGAVAPDSPFYAERAADEEFLKALRANESIILIKGPRQMGKTSLIGRGAKAVGELEWRQVSTDFQKLSTSQMATDDSFYKLLAATLARQQKFKYDFAEEWIDIFGANMNLDNFIRALLDASETPLVWFMDEADKLFGVPYASDFFGLVRSWHNSRATEPSGPWRRFTVVIGYATEAHLFIQDLNQSPFNVGRQIPLQSFNLDQTSDLNARYGSPLTRRADVEQLQALVGGQPFLTRRALDVVARGQMDFATLMATADRDDGAFGDHLKRILVSVTQLPTVMQALKTSLTDSTVSQADGYQRLIAAGVLKLTPDNRLTVACELYRRYLTQHV